MNVPMAPGVGLPGRGPWALRVVGLCGLLILVVSCFGPVLFGGRQFAFRDSGHFYYPLYWKVQQQWQAGLLPLWDPSEDGGMPLLGSPQAAVLYPGKLIHAALPYAWATRIYIVAHILLAFAGMRLMLRSWGVGGVGATLAGFAYAFGNSVLAMQCNVIFLVGAAWAPLGFRAADGWLRLGRRWALIELALVLAMQGLGGDIEAAYLTGLCAAGYAVGLTSRRPSFWIWSAAIALALAGWSIVAAWLGPRLIVLHSSAARIALALAWGIALLALFAKGLRGRERSPLGSRILGLAGAGVLAVALGAVQFVPVAETLANSGRWSEYYLKGTEDFSLQPFRAVEWAWPNAFGSVLTGERFWLQLIPSKVRGHQIWIPSLYMGTLPLVLILGAFGFRGGPPWRSWLSAVAILAFLAAAGQFVDPSSWFGFRGGGSLYRLMMTILPGFAGFRFPSKLLVFVNLALAGLAGIGWDRLANGGRDRRATAWATVLLALGLITLAIVILNRASIVQALTQASLGGSNSIYGPLDPARIWADMRWNLGHAVIASSLALAVIVLARRRPLLAGASAILILAVDLSVANSGLILTIPQEVFDRPGEVSRILQAAEGSRTPEGRIRIYRLAAWPPSSWRQKSSDTRAVDLATWERETLLPNYGALDGIDTVLSGSGAVEPEDHDMFFRYSVQPIYPKLAAAIGIEPGRPVLFYPRRAFDLWNVRYFLLPAVPGDWRQPDRAMISFLDQTELIYPLPGNRLDRPGLEDIQIRRNLAAYPRAWTVHDFLAIDPTATKESAELAQLAAEHLAKEPSTTPIPRGLTFDPHTVALIETRTPEALRPYRTMARPVEAELPKIIDDGPSRVELSVTLEQPGLVVLADRFNSGWQATIDGKPATILKANRLMRALAVEKGSHQIVFRYEPHSLRLGAIISLLALPTLLAACVWARRANGGHRRRGFEGVDGGRGGQVSLLIN